MDNSNYQSKFKFLERKEKEVTVEDPYQWYEQPTIHISLSVEEEKTRNGDNVYLARVYCASIDDFNMIYKREFPANRENLSKIIDTMNEIYNQVTDGVSISFLKKLGFQPT